MKVAREQLGYRLRFSPNQSRVCLLAEYALLQKNLGRSGLAPNGRACVALDRYGDQYATLV